jgi:hypothetical protein
MLTGRMLAPVRWQLAMAIGRADVVGPLDVALGGAIAGMPENAL